MNEENNKLPLYDGINKITVTSDINEFKNSLSSGYGDIIYDSSTGISYTSTTGNNLSPISNYYSGYASIDKYGDCSIESGYEKLEREIRENIIDKFIKSDEESIKEDRDLVIRYIRDILLSEIDSEDSSIIKSVLEDNKELKSKVEELEKRNLDLLNKLNNISLRLDMMESRNNVGSRSYGSSQSTSTPNTSTFIY